MQFDMQILLAMQQNDDDAWEKAYEVLWPVALYAVNECMGEPFIKPYAEDIAMEAIIAFQKGGIKECKTPGGIVAFVKRSARFKAIDFIRLAINRAVAAREDAQIEKALGDYDGMMGDDDIHVLGHLDRFKEALCLHDVNIETIMDALGYVLGLNELDKSLLWEHVIADLKQREFAERHGVSVKGVGARKGRILKKIRAFLENPTKLKRIGEEIRRRGEHE